MLGVSGLAKIEQPEYFTDTLRHHRILPTWSVIAVSRAVPYLEVWVAISLIAGLAPVTTAAVVLTLFVSFLVIEVILVVTKRATDCGCYGIAYPQKVDGDSIVVSSILALLAAFHLWGVIWVTPVSIEWRLPIIILFGGTGVWLLSKMIARRRARRERLAARRAMMQPEGQKQA